jgi:hypothetical protein
VRIFIKVNILVANFRALENTFGRMEVSIRVTLKMELGAGMVCG